MPPAVRAAADGITADTLARDLDYLASDTLLGRDTGSAGFDAAAEYIARRLQAAGVAPLGDPRAMPKGVDIPQVGRVAVGATSVFVEADHLGAARDNDDAGADGGGGDRPGAEA